MKNLNPSKEMWFNQEFIFAKSLCPAMKYLVPRSIRVSINKLNNIKA